MKLDIVNGQITFVGKIKEEKKIETALALMADAMGETHPLFFDNSDEDSNYCDIGFAYDMDEWKIEDIKWQWRKIKASI